MLYAPCSLPFYYEMKDLGYNYRITDFQCALGISQLQKLPGFLARRREIAAQYDEALAAMPGIEPLGLRADVQTTSQSAKRRRKNPNVLRSTFCTLRYAPCAVRPALCIWLQAPCSPPMHIIFMLLE